MAGFNVMLVEKRMGMERTLSSALKKGLNLTDAVADQIVGLIPVILFSDLKRKQAMALVDALPNVTQAGGKLVVSNAPPGSVRAINWPTLPMVNGRALAAYEDGAPPPMPAPVPRAASPAGGLAAAGMQAPPRPGTTRAVVTKCPVCGANLLLAAGAAGASASGPHAAPGAGVSPLPAAPPAPAAPAASGAPPRRRIIRRPPTRPPAPPSAGDMSTGLTPRPGTVAAQKSPPPPPPPAPAPAAPKAGGGLIIEEVGSIDDLDLAGEGRRPDVPVLPKEKPAPAQAPAPPPSGQDSQLGVSAIAPMDLGDFEAGLLGDGGVELLEELDANLPNEDAGEDLLAGLEELPGIEIQAEPAESNVADDKPAPAPGGGAATEPGDYSVTISKAGKSTRMVEAISQVMGVSMKDAEAMAKKPVVSVAKDVSKKSADDIKSRLAEMDVKARVNRKGGSGRRKRR